MMMKARLALLALCLALAVCLALRQSQQHRADTITVLVNGAPQGSPRPSTKTTPRLHVVTIVTDTQNVNLQRLLTGAAFHGIRVDVLISKQAFGPLHGWGPRLRVLKNYLSTLPGGDVVMFVDGYDVLIDGTADEVLSRFDATLKDKGKILFSGENACWPDAGMAAQYPPNPSPYKYLNGGTYIATAHTLRTMLDRHMDFNSPSFDAIDDQREWTRVYLKTGDIQLDSGNAIFNCLFDRTGDLVPAEKGWYNTATKSYPLVFHGNGSSKKHLFDVTMPGLKCKGVLK